jgi:mono/diheme cytochrome c family protein
VHACAQCHNPRLNPTLSRAQFNALDLDGLSEEQRVRIIDRLQRADDDRYRMPPRAFRDLSAAEIEAVVAFLRPR